MKMKLVFGLILLMAVSTKAFAKAPAQDFLNDKGVGEAMLRVVRNLDAPNGSDIKSGPIEAWLASEDCGFAGCTESYLIFQKFTFNPGANLKSGSVAALIKYNIQGQVDSIKVIAESGRDQ